MKFSIDARVFEKFACLNVGAVIAKNVDNSGGAEEIQAMLAEQEKKVRAEFNLETLSQQPKIDVWRKAYAAFGGKPKENRSSVENLHRIVLKGIALKHINKVVDAYNAVSLKHTLPCGGEDLDHIEGDVELTFASANEAPVLLLGEKEERPPHEGEVIYRDARSTICRRWNWREADRTKLTEQTKNCILVIEGLPPTTREEVERATIELKELVQKHCSGTLTHEILRAERPEIDL